MYNCACPLLMRSLSVPSSVQLVYMYIERAERCPNLIVHWIKTKCPDFRVLFRAFTLFMIPCCEMACIYIAEHWICYPTILALQPPTACACVVYLSFVRFGKISDKVRKFAASIAEDEKLISKFKKDESEKLKVCHGGSQGASRDKCGRITLHVSTPSLQTSKHNVCAALLWYLGYWGFGGSNWRATEEERRHQKGHGWASMYMCVCMFDDYYVVVLLMLGACHAWSEEDASKLYQRHNSNSEKDWHVGMWRYVKYIHAYISTYLHT